MRTRAYRRHQRARTKARHLRDYYELSPSWAQQWDPPKDIAVRHPRDCGRRCQLCHWDKLNEPRRTREDRAWQRYEASAWM